jgi:predicted nuclease of predicted toxin-antitoxin system
MKFWLNANLSPKLARWIESSGLHECKTIKELGLLNENDRVIFEKARQEKVVVITKDSDFREMVLRLGSPPQVLWITTGNTSTSFLIEVFEGTLPKAIKHLEAGAPLVEISQ